MSSNHGIDLLLDGNVRLFNNNADKKNEINKYFYPTAGKKKVDNSDIVDDMSILVVSQRN